MENSKCGEHYNGDLLPWCFENIQQWDFTQTGMGCAIRGDIPSELALVHPRRLRRDKWMRRRVVCSRHGFDRREHGALQALKWPTWLSCNGEGDIAQGDSRSQSRPEHTGPYRPP